MLLLLLLLLLLHQSIDSESLRSVFAVLLVHMLLSAVEFCAVVFLLNVGEVSLILIVMLSVMLLVVMKLVVIYI